MEKYGYYRYTASGAVTIATEERMRRRFEEYGHEYEAITELEYMQSRLDEACKDYADGLHNEDIQYHLRRLALSLDDCGGIDEEYLADTDREAEDYTDFANCVDTMYTLLEGLMADIKEVLEDLEYMSDTAKRIVDLQECIQELQE